MSHKFKIGAKVKLIPGKEYSSQAQYWDFDYGIIHKKPYKSSGEKWVGIYSGEYRNTYPITSLKLIIQSLKDLLEG